MVQADPLLNASDYSREMSKRTGWLRFAPAVETEYRRAHLRRVRNRARLWQTIKLAAVFAGGFSLVDSPLWRQHESIFLLGMGVHGALSALLFALAFGPGYLHRYLPAASVLTPIQAVALAITVAALVHANGNGAALITINLFGLFFLSGLLFRQALVSAMLLASAFGLMQLWLEVASGAVYYSISSMLIILALVMYVAYEAEADSRVAFLEHGMARSDATRDALSGLINRRHFDAKLAELWQNRAAAQQPLTTLLVDIDHFKKYNDHYGHQAGDAVLRRVAGALREAARPEDIVARYGGEEFALIGTGLDEAGAELLAERLRRGVERLELAHAASPTAGQVSISVGGAWMVPSADRSPEGALQLADENLYAAKQNGRNRVIFRVKEYDGLKTGAFRRSDFEQELK